MKTIIAGSRSITDPKILEDAIASAPFKITEIISGGARGADRLGEEYAKKNGIPLTVIPAEWDKYGKKAGHLRNEKMAQQGEALIALWDGLSSGTANMLKNADKHNLRVHLVKVKSGQEDDLNWLYNEPHIPKHTDL